MQNYSVFSVIIQKQREQISLLLDALGAKGNIFKMFDVNSFATPKNHNNYWLYNDNNAEEGQYENNSIGKPFFCREIEKRSLRW